MKKQRNIKIDYGDGQCHEIRRGTEQAFIAQFLVRHNDAQAVGITKHHNVINDNVRRIYGELSSINRKYTIIVLIFLVYTLLNLAVSVVVLQKHQHLPKNAHIEKTNETNAMPAPIMAIPIAHLDSSNLTPSAAFGD